MGESGCRYACRQEEEEEGERRRVDGWMDVADRVWN
jgi:hypothetical protein